MLALKAFVAAHHGGLEDENEFFVHPTFSIVDSYPILVV